MSVRIAYLLPSITNPIATPATGDFKGTPASINDKIPPQTLAIDDEPFDSVISDTMRIVYGKTDSSGRIGSIARRASTPCPISRRLEYLYQPTSPHEELDTFPSRRPSGIISRKS